MNARFSRAALTIAVLLSILVFSCGDAADTPANAPETPVSGASSNADLASVTFDAGVMSRIFDPSVRSYTLYVYSTVADVAVTAVAGDPDAAVAYSPSANPSLSPGDNTLVIAVTAPDAVTRNEYTFTIARAPETFDLPPAADGAWSLNGKTRIWIQDSKLSVFGADSITTGAQFDATGILYMVDMSMRYAWPLSAYTWDGTVIKLGGTALTRS